MGHESVLHLDEPHRAQSPTVRFSDDRFRSSSGMLWLALQPELPGQAGTASLSAQAFANARSGSTDPGVVAQPVFMRTSVRW